MSAGGEFFLHPSGSSWLGLGVKTVGIGEGAATSHIRRACSTSEYGYGVEVRQIVRPIAWLAGVTHEARLSNGGDAWYSRSLVRGKTRPRDAGVRRILESRRSGRSLSFLLAELVVFPMLARTRDPMPKHAAHPLPVCVGPRAATR